MENESKKFFYDAMNRSYNSAEVKTPQNYIVLSENNYVAVPIDYTINNQGSITILPEEIKEED